MNQRRLYQPIQPTIRPLENTVTYHESLPAPSLQHIIFCYWELKTTQPLSSPFIYRVVADGCIDIFFERSSPAESYVMGFSEKYTEFPLAKNFHYIGIRFLPSMFPQLFKISAKELTNRYERLELIHKDLSFFIEEQLTAFDDLSNMSRLMDRYFLHQLAHIALQSDPRFDQAMELIYRSHGTLETETDLNTGISPRQLRRIFNYYIGTTPKTFCKVVRFQQILKAKPSVQSLKKSKIFYDIGYFDQAHFIKDFKNFYGLTPTKALL